MPAPLWAKAAKFHQVGIVVPDLASAIEATSAALGIPREDWAVLDSGKPFEHHEGGTTVLAQTRYARAQSGPTVYQLIEPVSGDTIWQRWLDSGVTVFAAGYFIRDLPAAEQELIAQGGERLAWGSVREDADEFRYSFVKLAGSGLVVELMTQVTP